MKLVNRILIIIGLLALTVCGVIGIRLYNRILKPNIKLEQPDSILFHIPTGSNVHDVQELLFSSGYLKDSSTFRWLANKKNYKAHVYAGRFMIKDRMNNNQLIDVLRSGINIPLNLTINNIRKKEQLSGRVSRYLETDSASLISLLNDTTFLARYGFNEETITAMFIPNTYEFFWNTSAEQFFNRMFREYKSFWNEKRINRAGEIGFTPLEVSILASIVEWETIKNDEKPVVAGLYYNRLKKRMKLQADPTVIYAIGDFSIRRVLSKHLKFDSPYNTYKYEGLPPGPIKIPQISSIDAVLYYEEHDYVYMCAKEDFSGYHNFASNLSQHNRNARKYRKALNERNVFN